MKLGFKYASQVWGYHLAAMLIGFFFIGNMSGSVFGLIVNAILVLGMIAMSLNNGAYLGEKGCTLAVSIEKQIADGRKVDESLKTQVFNRKVAAWIMIFGCLPFLLVSTANMISQPFYPVEEVVEEIVVEEKEAFSFEYSEDQEEVQGTFNPFNLVARMVFMPFVSVYTMVSSSALNVLFFLFSLPLPAAAAIGYLAGPAMRQKKLHDIALGKKRKMRGLKVNKKPKAPKAPKAEV